MPFAPHPWNQDAWRVSNSAHSQKLPGWLFSGPDGVGKFDCALSLAASRLCANNQPGEAACAECQQCLLFQAGTHPDFHLLIPERSFDEDSDVMRAALRYMQDPQSIKNRKPRAVISVDQIRTLIDNIVTAAQVSLEKAVVIRPADCLNMNAANALLKVLEEPPTGTTFVLVTSRPWKLPPTVNSRTSKVSFSIPDTQQALAWLSEQLLDSSDQEIESALAESNGAPLTALARLQSDDTGYSVQLEQQFVSLLQKKIDPLAMAKTWQTLPRYGLLDELQILLSKLARAGAGSTASGKTEDELKKLASRIPANRTFPMFDILGQRKSLLDTGVDETLMLEEICIDLAALVSKRS